MTHTGLQEIRQLLLSDLDKNGMTESYTPTNALLYTVKY